MDIEDVELEVLPVVSSRKFTKSLLKLSLKPGASLKNLRFSYEQFFELDEYISILFRSKDGRKFLKRLILDNKQTLWSELMSFPLFSQYLFNQGPFLFKAVMILLKENNLEFFEKIFTEKPAQEGLVHYLRQISPAEYHEVLKHLYQDREKNRVLQAMLSLPDFLSLIPLFMTIHYSSCGLLGPNEDSAKLLLQDLLSSQSKKEQSQLFMQRVNNHTSLRVIHEKYGKSKEQLNKIMVLTSLENPELFEKLYAHFSLLYPKNQEEFFQSFINGFFENGSCQPKLTWPIYSTTFHIAFSYEYTNSPELYQRLAIDFLFKSIDRIADPLREQKFFQQLTTVFSFLNEKALYKAVFLLLDKKYLNKYFSYIAPYDIAENFYLRTGFIHAFADYQWVLEDFLSFDLATMSTISCLLTHQIPQQKFPGKYEKRFYLKRAQAFERFLHSKQKKIEPLLKCLHLFSFGDLCQVSLDNIFQQKKFSIGENSMTLCLLYSLSLTLLGKELLLEKDFFRLTQHNDVLSDRQYQSYLDKLVCELKILLRSPLLEDGVFHVLKGFSRALDHHYALCEQTSFQKRSYLQACEFLFELTKNLPWRKPGRADDCLCYFSFQRPLESSLARPYSLSSSHSSPLLFDRIRENDKQLSRRKISL